MQLRDRTIKTTITSVEHDNDSFLHIERFEIHMLQQECEVSQLHTLTSKCVKWS